MAKRKAKKKAKRARGTTNTTISNCVFHVTGLDKAAVQTVESIAYAISTNAEALKTNADAAKALAEVLKISGMSVRAVNVGGAA